MTPGTGERWYRDMDTTVTVGGKKGLTGNALKIIAIIAMFIDHFAAILVTDYLMNVTPNLQGEELQAWFQTHIYVAVLEMVMGCMRLIGRFGFPLFAFLLVEGFTHTRSVKNYAIKLGIFALISELPFNLGFSSKLLDPNYQNVFFTLLLGLLSLAAMHFLGEKQGKKEKWKPLFYVTALFLGPYGVYMLLKNCWVVELFFHPQGNMIWILMACAAVLCLVLFTVLGRGWDTEKKNRFAFTFLSLMVFSMLAELLMTDYSGGGVLTIVVMYLLRANRKKAFGFGVLVLTLMTPVEAMAFFMLIPVSKYNGERGMKLNKYFFYVFYPAHIGLLYLVTYLLGFTTFALR